MRTHNEKKTKRTLTTKRDGLKKKCDALWSEIVKKKAGYKSEISGKEGRQIGGASILNAHHMHGKSSYRLRYEIRNGICLTNGEHTFGIHHEGRRQEYEAKIRAVRGDDWHYCLGLKNDTSKGSLILIHEYLLSVFESLEDSNE